MNEFEKKHRDSNFYRRVFLNISVAGMDGVVTNFLIMLSTVFLLGSCSNREKKSTAEIKQADSTMLCIGNYWTESEGKEFLEEQRKHYTTVEAWEKRSELIRIQI